MILYSIQKKIHLIGSTGVGSTLVELLISLLLGSLVVISATELLLVHGKINKFLFSQSNIQENGRFSLYFLTYDLRMAGHSLTESIEPIDWEKTLDGGKDGLTKDNDELALMRISTNDDYNCLGSPVAPGTLVQSHYYISEEKLLCAADYWIYSDDPGSDLEHKEFTQTIIEGVESFQVLYGVGLQKGIQGTDTYESGRQYVEAYVDASTANTENVQIQSVQFAVLLKDDRLLFLSAKDGEGDSESEGDPKKESEVKVLDRTYELDESSSMRRLFQATVRLRNLPKDLPKNIPKIAKS